jgi:hypothetical protein
MRIGDRSELKTIAYIEARPSLSSFRLLKRAQKPFKAQFVVSGKES